jgi:hypothetical protein
MSNVRLLEIDLGLSTKKVFFYFISQVSSVYKSI